MALDDTITRKTGHRIPNASTLRDPLSPAYHTNLVWALRFIQAVLLICPIDGVGAARAIPIAFNLAPPVPKPKKKRAPKTASADTNDKSDANMKKVGKKTPDPEWKQYYKMRRQQGLSAQGGLLIQQIRSRLDDIADFAPTHLVGRCRWQLLQSHGVESAARTHRLDWTNPQRHSSVGFA